LIDVERDQQTTGKKEGEREREFMEEKLETLTIKDYVDIYNLLVGVLLCFSDDYMPYEILF